MSKLLLIFIFTVDNSSLIHDFYRGECQEPIHLVVDSHLTGDNFGIRAFVSSPMVVGLSSFANMFQEVRVQAVLTDGEVSCLHQIIHGQMEQGRQVISSGPTWDNTSSTIFSVCSDEREKLISALEKLSEVHKHST